MQQTYVYLTSILLCLNLLTARSEEKKTNSKAEEVKWWSGMLVQVDAASFIYSSIMKGDTYTMEGSAQLGIKQKIYPVVEIGLAGADKTMTSLASYKTNAPFGRVGVDINLLSPKKDEKPTNNLFLVGIRLGFSNFSYDVNNLIIKDEYWGKSETKNYPNEIANKAWYELVAGLRVEVYKNIYLGWNVRNRNLLSKETVGSISPWYIPGYGLNGSSNWGFNYTIGYKF
jgi:hypothetical protein